MANALSNFGTDHLEAPRHVDHYDGERFVNLDQRKFKNNTVDVCIVGAGAAGGVLAQRLAEAGLSVVIIEAGPFWDPAGDFASDELEMMKLGWQETVLVGGSDAPKMGHNNTGRGVGGGTTHFTGVFLRYHPSDFNTYSRDGVGVDWPLTYDDLEPYYTAMEHEIAVSGPKHFPWGAFNGPYPYPEREPISSNSMMFRRGCEKLGIESSVPPLAILSAPKDGRPPCINRGFCTQGCKPNSKFSTLIQHIPQALAAGAEVLSDCMVTELEMDRSGRIESVVFTHNGKTYKQKAHIIVLSNFVIQTPRLLLQTTNARFPNGLANSSGLVGTHVMVHSSHDMYALFDEEIRMYKGTPVLATTQAFYTTDTTRGFARGYTLHAHGSRPVAFAAGLAGAGIWGQELRTAMRDFNYYGRITLVGETLPAAHNAVTLSDEKDEYGLPRAEFSFSYGENDNKMITHAVDTANAILEAAGGAPRYVVPDTAHLMGGCRMGDDPETSVVDKDCRAHDVPNLYICSAAVFPTAGGGNPTATIMAVAARTADRLIEHAKTYGLGAVASATS